MTLGKESNRPTNAKSGNKGQPASPPRRARLTPVAVTAIIAIAIALLALMWPNDIKQSEEEALASQAR